MLRRASRAGDIHSGKWNGLGGKFEAGESPEQCAYREIQEESGLSGGNLYWQGVITFPQFDGENDWYVFVFTGTAFVGSLRPSAEGSLDWIPDQELFELNLWEGDRIFLPWLEEKQFFSARFCYQAGALKSHEVHFYAEKR